MTGIIAQARLDSTRLPRKALLPFAGTTLLGSALRRLSRIPAKVRVLAVDEASLAELTPVAEEAGFEIMAGPKDDVLLRFELVIRAYGMDRVVRATGDNPLVSPELAVLLLKSAKRTDYAGYEGMPVGLGVEIVDAGALLEASEEAEDAYEREHVCPFLYRRPDRFRIVKPGVPEPYRFPEGRITVDTDADYRSALEIVEALGPDPATLDIVGFLKRRKLP
ncbi:MAG: NTP transferase domain-containing protein [Spirochaetes bacterium]|nr:NTP transferase domain-containing protein [Spirochaetota bacterium]